MSISILDSQINETYPQLFTKPLRGVLGGRQITDRKNDLDKNAQDCAIFKVWQRVLVGILLFTVALPYTFFAAVVLAGTALLALKKKDGWLTENDEKALSKIFEGTKVDFKNAKMGGIIFDEDGRDKVSVREPTWFRVNIGNSCELCLVIPIVQIKEHSYRSTVCVISKHPHDTGPEAAWACLIDKKHNFHLPLHKDPKAEDVQVLKELMLRNQTVTIGGLDYLLGGDR